MREKNAKENPFEISIYDLDSKPKVDELFLIEEPLTEFLLKLVYFIERNLKKGEQETILVRKEIEMETEMTSLSVIKAIDEAVRRRFIAKRRVNYYWINPKLFYELKK